MIETMELYNEYGIEIFVVVGDHHGAEYPYIEVMVNWEYEFVYSVPGDNDVCPHCGCKELIVDGIDIDPCLGKPLPGVKNMCCGHGNPYDAYIQWDELAIHQLSSIYPTYTATYGLIAYSIIEHFKSGGW